MKRILILTDIPLHVMLMLNHLKRMEKLLKLQAQAIASLQQAIDFAEQNNLHNTQEFLNFLDDINELSVSY